MEVKAISMALSAALPARDSNFPCCPVLCRIIGFILFYFIALITCLGAVYILSNDSGILYFLVMYTCGILILLIGSYCLIGVGKQFKGCCGLPQMIFGLLADLAMIGIIISIIFYPTKIWIITVLVIIQFITFLLYMIGFVYILAKKVIFD